MQRIYTLFFILFLTFFNGNLKAVSQPNINYKYDLAVCAVFQNEAPYLKEWIEFHKLVGVQHFYLFNNLSTDNYKAVLQPYINRGEVELIEWPRSSSNDIEWNKIQCSAYSHALKLAMRKVRWLAILDLDEFLFPTHADNLVTLLADYESFGGVVVNWQMFGTSHVPSIPQDKLMIEMLTLRAPVAYGENAMVKSIVHPHRVKECHDPHKMEYQVGFYAVNSNKTPVKTSKGPIVVDKFRINHYWSRDEHFFYNVKVPRRQKWREGFDGQLRRLNNLNSEGDWTIQRFVPSLKEKVTN